VFHPSFIRGSRPKILPAAIADHEHETPAKRARVKRVVVEEKQVPEERVLIISISPWWCGRGVGEVAAEVDPLLQRRPPVNELTASTASW